MIVQKYQSWKAFYTRFLDPYHHLPEARRRQLVFRGHASSKWGLRASLDRQRTFPTAVDRRACLERLVNEFRRQARSINSSLDLIAFGDWELLGRHHGLPTTVLDFSASPYIAGWFAFSDAAPPGTAYVSVWMLDRDEFDRQDVSEVEIVDNEDAIRFNPRAQIQQGMFLRVQDASAGPPEVVLSDALTRHDIRAADRTVVLGMLEEMTITARTMYSDLNAAAQAATARVMVIGEG